MNQGQYNSHANTVPSRAAPSLPVQQQTTQSIVPRSDDVIQLAGQVKNIIMVANQVSLVPSPKITTTAHTYALTSRVVNSYTWFIDSAASSHLSGNLDLFTLMHEIAPVTIETASGDSFVATQRGTIHIDIVSDPTFRLPDVPITLTDPGLSGLPILF
jgi:Pol polyprotein, beta-barrel domain